MESDRWPALPYEDWAQTRETVHRWVQVLGKIKLASTPFLNEWWNVGLTLTARGLSTGPMPAGEVDLQLDLHLVGSRLLLLTSDGRQAEVELRPRTVADFHAACRRALADLGVEVKFSARPAELPGAVPFDQDTEHAAYDPQAVRRWWRAMLSVSRVIERFRTPFGGKSSPVLLYWGGFDLNHTRFSGRPAPARPDADRVLALGEDQENLAVGFWPGSAESPGAVLYAYLAPAPDGMADLAVEPAGATWVPPLGEFVLPWDVLLAADDPDATALRFFTSVYEQAAALAGWDRTALELPVRTVA